ncbi:MAG: DUF1015 domain-containing protein [Clostridia bacterium]|nr:DUF1015 domain-containing protein [Clostridia bacterium]
MKDQRICFYPADILIPRQAEMEKWSVVACDQYTSEPEYWEQVRQIVGDAPSTLKMVLPEAELETADPTTAQKTMNEYLAGNVFRTLKNSFVYLQRTQSDGKVRQGLIGALDLECYDYHKGATSLCRATEGTVEERLPPRIRVRQNAALEMPHIMILIDDPQFTVIEPLKTKTSQMEKIYDFSLMQGGGHLTGYAVSESQAFPSMNALERLMGTVPSPFLYAVGDGNHSLATAKACYQQLKEQLGDAALNHPARYCLVELVNIHSPALDFEPIHRVVFDVDPEHLLNELKKAGLAEGSSGRQKVQVLVKEKDCPYSFEKETAALPVGSLQNALDAYLKAFGGRIDYIHGADVVKRLVAQNNAVGFILPGMSKSDLFPTVIADGALPRKTFSMGHAQDKRFYLECRRIDQNNTK